MFPEINSKGGKPDAFPQQLKKLQSENARLGSARSSKLSNGTGVGTLPKLNSKPQPVHPAKSNFHLCGTFPYISDKHKPNNLPVQQGRLHEKNSEFKCTGRTSQSALTPRARLTSRSARDCWRDMHSPWLPQYL
ncbi:hypothetical protein AOLI_G00180680 [Acnodon oligacanthus]